MADPRFASLDGTRGQQVKTNWQDAQAPVEAQRLGSYRPAHRVSEEQICVRAGLGVRDTGWLRVSHPRGL
ncbi:MAG: hypothetical protein AB1486_10130 [Planctomycetota bacterium]